LVNERLDETIKWGRFVRIDQDRREKKVIRKRSVAIESKEEYVRADKESKTAAFCLNSVLWLLVDESDKVISRLTTPRSASSAVFVLNVVLSWCVHSLSATPNSGQKTWFDKEGQKSRVVSQLGSHPHLQSACQYKES
jgi:hypothetical protein